jgi:hypothetical protein
MHLPQDRPWIDSTRVLQVAGGDETGDAAGQIGQDKDGHA